MLTFFQYLIVLFKAGRKTIENGDFIVIPNIYLLECLRRLNLLQICMNHILTVLKTPQDRDSGFIALGEMAGALDGELIHYLPTITTHLREAVCFCNCYLMSVFSHNLSYHRLH